MRPNFKEPQKAEEDLPSGWLPVVLGLVALFVAFYLRSDIVSYINTSAHPDYLPSSWTTAIDWRWQLVGVVTAGIPILLGSKGLMKRSGKLTTLSIIAIWLGLLAIMITLIPLEFVSG